MSFVHETLLYESERELVERLVPFVRGGLTAGEAVMVALPAPSIRALRGALGADADAVRFVDMVALGRNPGRIIPAWREFVDAAGGQPVRGVGEPAYAGRSADELDECMRHERLLNTAFAGGTSWQLICPYDVGAADSETLAAAAECHGEHSAVDDDPYAGALPDPPASARELSFSSGRLSELRSAVAAGATRAGLGPDRTFDLTLAVTELAANSIRHAGGTGIARTWTQDGTLVWEVTDGGRVEDPLAGRIRPVDHLPDGRGLWMVHQIADLVRVRSSEAGTVVRVHVEPAVEV